MRTETYTQADRRAEKLMDTVLTAPHTESGVAKAIRAGNIWRALSTGEGWVAPAAGGSGADPEGSPS